MMSAHCGRGLNIQVKEVYSAVNSITILICIQYVILLTAMTTGSSV